MEFCGGTHLSNVAQAKFFAIVEEGSISKGIRRVVAITGDRANESLVLAKQIEAMLSHARSLHGKELEAAVTELQQTIPAAVISVATKAHLKEELKSIEKMMMAEKKEVAAKQLEEALRGVEAVVKEVKERRFLRRKKRKRSRLTATCASTATNPDTRRESVHCFIRN